LHENLNSFLLWYIKIALDLIGTTLRIVAFSSLMAALVGVESPQPKGLEARSISAGLDEAEES